MGGQRGEGEQVSEDSKNENEEGKI